MRIKAKHAAIASTTLLACIAVGLSVVQAAKPRKIRVTHDNSTTRGVTHDNLTTRGVTYETVATRGIAFRGTSIAHTTSSLIQHRAAMDLDAQNRHEAFQSRNRGTNVAPSDAATGAERKLHEDIGKAFAQGDPIPKQRLEHFRWCDTPWLGCRGWNGQIREVSRTPDGSWLVMVRFHPYLVSNIAALTHTPDYYDETYLYSGGALQFVEGSEPKGGSLKGTIFGD